MTSQVRVIVQLARDGAVDRTLRADPAPSLADDRVVLEHLDGDESGAIGLPEAGEVVMSVLSPEGLTREQPEIRRVVREAERTSEPLVITVDAGEYLREDELQVVLDAAERADRLVILRIMADA